MGARPDAVIAGDAAGEVDGAAPQLDALRLADAQALGAFGTCAFVDLDPERGVASQPAEQRPDWAEGVAVKPSPPHHQHHEQDQ